MKVIDLKDLLKFADQCPDITPEVMPGELAPCGCGGEAKKYCLTNGSVQSVYCEICGVNAKEVYVWNRAMGVKLRRKVLRFQFTEKKANFQVAVDIGDEVFVDDGGNPFCGEWRNE